MGADEIEKSSQERAAIRAVPLGDQVVKLIDLHGDKARAEQERQAQPPQHMARLVTVQREHRVAVGDAAQ